jgi:predicted RNase H-related nuclease YkuK (DUF458 family)
MHVNNDITKNIQIIRDAIAKASSTSVIYIGGDSEKYKRKGIFWVDYTLAVVIHVDGCRGGKVFGYKVTERDYDVKKEHPILRLRNEVIKISELYLSIADLLEDRMFEIHLDLNPDEIYPSAAIVQEAIGYIRGTCNVTPKIKPDSFAASCVADRLKEISNGRWVE